MYDEGLGDIYSGIQKTVAGLMVAKVGASLAQLFSITSGVLIVDDATGAGVTDDGLLVVSLAGLTFSAKASLEGVVVAAKGIGQAVNGAKKVINAKSNQKQSSAVLPSPLPPDDDDSDPEFKNSKETAKKFNTNTKNYERNVKKEILKDARGDTENKQLNKFLRNNDNPDIGTDSRGNIWLKSRLSGETIKTDLNVNMYTD